MAALERVETPKGLRLAVTKVEKGRKAEQVLPAILERLVSGLRFRKAMRSRYDEVTFARPVRWMVALLGGQPGAGPPRRGAQRTDHRSATASSPPGPSRSPATPEDYVARLRKAHVLVDPDERRAGGREGARAGGPQGGGVAPARRGAASSR